jgi:3-polyprenyl-4-hydroxybenzoate decarboxylase
VPPNINLLVSTSSIYSDILSDPYGFHEHLLILCLDHSDEEEEYGSHTMVVDAPEKKPSKSKRATPKKCSPISKRNDKAARKLDTASIL